jgi:hypothetical protein
LPRRGQIGVTVNRSRSGKRVYTREEVKELIGALEGQAGEAIKLAKMAETEAAKDSFSVYNQFRGKVQEFRALCALIETRLENFGNARMDDLREEYARLDMLMLQLLVRASMRFFVVLSEKEALPLGARDIFEAELRSLSDAREKLMLPEYEGSLGDDIRADLQKAEQVLNFIIASSPGLIDFGAMPA